jgi:hypothetical protein
MGANVLQEAAAFVNGIDSSLSIVTVGSSETLVHIHPTQRLHIPEDRNINNNDTFKTRFNLGNSHPAPAYSLHNDSF